MALYIKRHELEHLPDPGDICLLGQGGEGIIELHFGANKGEEPA